MEKYVCTFRGRRDFYQVPLALAEAGLLDMFITDFYAFPAIQKLSRCLPAHRREKINGRYESGIPDHLVECLWRTTLLEHGRHLTGCSASVTFAKLDAHFSRAAARQAKKQRTNLFLYSPYAWEAFEERYPHSPHKVLFQYHPHHILESEILARDYAKHPFVADSYTEDTSQRLSADLLRRHQEAWRLADLIFCASSFTKQSLLKVGADESKCRVVPYGVDLPGGNPAVKAPETFCVLFVGSGIQRKGLHHLLLAWQKAKLPSGSQLVLVCRTIDRGIETLLEKTKGVELRRGVSKDDLSSLFYNSTLFAMPSLVEGFGQVYLEALSHGCPVLGTSHTCLPDLGNEADGIFIVPADDNIDALAARLESASKTLPGQDALRQQARACAERFSWARFRAELIKELKSSSH